MSEVADGARVIDLIAGGVTEEEAVQDLFSLRSASRLSITFYNSV